jgi:uncharacterized protein YjiS (DUF1127 family)
MNNTIDLRPSGLARFTDMLAAPARLLRRAMRAWQEWRHLARALRDLQSLDDITLRDLGLSHRAAAERPRAASYF